MGTSSGYSLPNGSKWSDAKRAVSSLGPISTITNLRTALHSHIRAYSDSPGTSIQGGVGGFRVARQAARELVSFVRDVQEIGLDSTLKKHDLGHLRGRPINEIIDGLVMTLSDGADYIEDVDARAAAAILLDEIFVDSTTPEDLEKKLREYLDNKSLCDLISKFFRHFLLEHFIRNYWRHLQNKYANDDITRIRGELREHLFRGLEFEIDNNEIGSVDWSSEEGKNLIARIEQRTYEVYA